MIRAEYGVHHVGNGVVGPIGFGLEILKFVDVLGDTLAVKMLSLQLVLQCEDIYGMKSTTRCLKVAKKLPHANQGIEVLGLIESAEPSFFDKSEDEFTRFVFRGFISGEVADTGLVDGLLPHSHQCLYVFPDVFISICQVLCRRGMRRCNPTCMLSGLE